MKTNSNVQMVAGGSAWTSSVLLFAILVSCTKDNINPEINGVEVKTDATFGKILTDGSGKSLYFFSNDIASASTCTGGCETTWPFFYVGDLKIGDGLDQADFGEITNGGGHKQSTYKGWPLYYYSGDTNAGDVMGDQVYDVWYVAKPDYSVMVGNFNNVKFLIAPDGKTLYTFANDTENTSACTSNACVTNWPPFLAGANSVVPSLLTETSVAEMDRTDGKQSAYKGSPLYYHNADLVRGDSTGQGLGGVWYKLTQTDF